MRMIVRAAGALALAAAAVLAFTAPAHAQGVTTASVRGKVVDQSGAPIVGATVTLTNTSTGQRFEAESRSGGLYNLENVPVGGPYLLVVKAIGYQPETHSNFRLALGQVLELPVTMNQTAVSLAPITVTAQQQNPLTSPDRTGAQTFVSDSQIARYPLYSRNFTEIINSAPQANGTSINGQNNRFNNIQIDGGVNNDLFGLASSGTPGGQSGARPISVEAIKEFQVLVAPFDVRQGGFTGGLVNAVTKSGTNEFHGSLFGYFENQALLGKDTIPGDTNSVFHNIQYGFSLGGPIVRDKVQFFVAGDFKSYSAPFGGQTIGTNPAGGADSVGIGITRATALRVQDIIKNTYGFDPGGPEAPDQKNPDRNLFAKVTAQLGTNSQLEISNNYVHASQDNLNHSPSINLFSAGSVAYGYELSNSGYGITNTTNSTRIKWNASFHNRFSNELLLSYQTVRDSRSLANNVPLLLVQGDRAGQYLGAGADRYSQGNFLDQNIAEVTDNLSITMGRHLFTIGTHNEFFSFDNGFFQASEGIYAFADTTDLKNNNPTYFQRAIDNSGSAGEANWSVKQLGGYVQDQFSAAPGLAITAGVRVDVPLLDSPIANPTLKNDLNLSTNTFPSGNPLISPRLGFNYDVSGDASTVIRGGVGLFTGRPPYVWLSNAFTNTGVGSGILVCTGANTPKYTTVLADVPKQCVDGTTIGATGSAGAVVFDQNFKFPRAAKIALGIDRNIGWGVIGTVDFLYTKWVDQMYINDANLQQLTGAAATAAGEGGRAMYGTINPGTGRSTPNRITGDFNEVLLHTNKSADRSVSITAQLQKHFSDGVEFDAAYTYSHAQDLMSLTSSIASSNFKYNAISGTLADRTLQNSDWNVPNSLRVSGTVNVPFGIAMSLVYTGQTGSAFTYMVTGDANGDGWSTNDAVYVPKSQSDITLQNPNDWTALNDYINSEPCLNSARGTVLPRNSCHNSWISFLDMRLAKSINTVNGQNLTVTFGVFNLLNLLNKQWGLVHQTSAFDTQNLLRLVGYDAANQRGVYTLSLPVKDYYSVTSTASRWKMQLGLKYGF